MSSEVTVKDAALAALVSGLAALTLGAAPSSGAALPLARGCNLGYGGQTIGASGGHRTTFSFQGYNAVPPTHRAKDGQINWGDGRTTAVMPMRRSAPFLSGCYVTNFTASHTYPAVPACGRPICTRTYHIIIRYRDAQTHARLALTMLHVIIGRVTTK